jgi:hypothetical protein
MDVAARLPKGFPGWEAAMFIPEKKGIRHPLDT